MTASIIRVGEVSKLFCGLQNKSRKTLLFITKDLNGPIVLYFSFAVCQLWNSHIMWEQQACKTYLEKMHKLHKWVLRKISNSHYLSHYLSHSTPLFHKYDILNVDDMFKLEVGVFMYRYLQT